MMRRMGWVVSMALLVALVGCRAGEGTTVREGVPTPSAPPATALPPPAALPTRDAAWEPIFGVELWPGGAALAPQANVAAGAWVRYNGIHWSDVEAVEGVRDWAALAAVEADLQALAAEGLTPMVVVRRTPEWAQALPGSLCGPIKEEALDAFADFMAEVVRRYSQPPYNVRYWEFGNEPDVDPALIEPTYYFGCWGDAADPFYGGGYYAEALKRIYPAMKAADPQAQLVLGGLLLDCDPAHPPEGKDCAPARFLEGVLATGGGAALDIVAYHAYPHWRADVQDWDTELAEWEPRGGALLGKLAFIRETMARYGVEKPIIMNEGGLLCHESNPACPSAAFHNDQAIHLVRMYSRAWAQGLMGAVWYTLTGPGWREGGLLDAAQQPRPAHATLAFMARLLDGATFRRDLSEGGLEGYEFEKGATRIQVYWSTDGASHALALPSGTRQVLGKDGQPLAAPQPFPVGREPVFIEIGE